MQYNHKVTIQYVDAFDDYGQPVETISKTMRCCILNESLTNSKTGSQQQNQYDMTLLVSAKTYEPYSKLFDDNLIKISKNSRIYEVKTISRVNGFSGKPKFYQVALSQVNK